MIENTLWTRVRFKVYALLLIVLILLAFLVSAIAYDRGFESTIPVTLQASRAGLQMHPNNRVKIRGVDLGFVRSVALNNDNTGVNIVLYLNPKLAAEVPANVTVSLDQLTAFGNKAIMMNYPANPSPDKLHPGSVITADHITTEVNNTFEKLMTLLGEVQPAKLNVTLGAFATTLQGRGELLGTTLTRADHYLAKFNGNLPQLQKDWQITAGFSQVYAGAAPNIASTVTNLGVTSRTLADGNWDPVLRSVVPAADSVGAFFGTAGKALSDALYSLYPTTSLLHDYAPEFTCFLDGSAKTYDTLNRTFVDESGIHFELTPVFGQPAYQYPNDLPEMPGPGPQVGPNCRGLPAVGEHELSMADYTTGPQSVRNTSGHQLSVPRQPAVVQFFGPNAILPSAVTGHELKPSKGSK